MKGYEVLVMDENQYILRAIGWILADQWYHVTTTSSSDAVIEMLCKKDFDVVITEHLAVLRKAKKHNPETMVIIMNGDYRITLAINALWRNDDEYIVKNVGIVDLVNV